MCGKVGRNSLAFLTRSKLHVFDLSLVLFPIKGQKVKGFGTNQIEEDIRDRVGTIQNAQRARSFH